MGERIALLNINHCRFQEEIDLWELAIVASEQRLQHLATHLQ